jgi:hypothetical protein
MSQAEDALTQRPVIRLGSGGRGFDKIDFAIALYLIGASLQTGAKDKQDKQLALKCFEIAWSWPRSVSMFRTWRLQRDRDRLQ